MNVTGRPDILRNKPKTYEVFKDYYKRDVLTISDSSQKDEFASFLSRYSPCLLKPLAGYGGFGILKIEVSKEQPAYTLFNTLINRLPFLLEELIVQSPEIGKFHPDSINTIRFTTFFNEEKLTKIQAVFRMGRGSHYVDNAHSGGIFALIDIATGIIKSPGMNFINETFLFHPDSGEQIIGAHIPHWDELNELLEKVVRVLPEQKLVGWDFALSTQGWVIVEANSMPDMQNLDPEHGMRDELLSIFSPALR